MTDKSFDAFKKRYEISREEMTRELFRENAESIRVKKEATAVRNLQRIIEAVFTISKVKGFQAMSMRDLCNESGLSMGGLYGYIKGKEELLALIQGQGRRLVERFLLESLTDLTDPFEKLDALIRVHIYLSEVARPWFFFNFMESRHLGKEDLTQALIMEAATEKALADLIEEGIALKTFAPCDAALLAGLIKSMQQDWYLKRWKFRKRKVTVERYADAVIEMAFFRLAL
ncbi:TetR/AcrR family transcriptional regulator [Desulfoluna sp.]|uniref:TetR/AcrR family transcriptional regulator n=1 Tax=Desulfoluna sp. TaxID=2045199 RepID=UPI00260DFE34|nr:TetR/AcrR family transcriptional regulator [Desulfoluna sp.]